MRNTSGRGRCVVQKQFFFQQRSRYEVRHNLLGTVRLDSKQSHLGNAFGASSWQLGVHGEVNPSEKRDDPAILGQGSRLRNTAPTAAGQMGTSREEWGVPIRGSRLLHGRARDHRTTQGPASEACGSFATLTWQSSIFSTECRIECW